MGVSDGSEVPLEPAWDFGGDCATGYTVAEVYDTGLIFSLLKIEAEEP